MRGEAGIADRRPPLPHRIGGNLALDLANTISSRGTALERDHLGDADAVLAWGEAAGLVDLPLGLDARARRALLADIHRLRGAIDEAGTAIAAGRPSAPGALATICDLAARTLSGGSLQGAPARLAFAGPDRVVGPIAWAALDLLRGDEVGKLKQCPAADCRWLFLDRTRNGSRRWCDMATCGDRAKKRRQARSPGPLSSS